MLADDLARAFDPVYLARDAGIEPDDWQARILRSQHKRIILNCTRQAGKSTISAIAALHQAVYTPNSLVLLVATKLDQAKELFLKVKTPFYNLEEVPAEIENESEIRVTFDNGSRILTLPGKATGIRGFSAPNLVIIDEAAHVLEELYVTLRPMLAVSNGRLILLSTPHGKQGSFYEAWEHGGADWHRERVPATEIKRISPEFLATERATFGFWYPQEYECVFMDTEQQFIATEDIMGAINTERKALAIKPLGAK